MMRRRLAPTFVIIAEMVSVDVHQLEITWRRLKTDSRKKIISKNHGQHSNEVKAKYGRHRYYC